MKGGLAVPLLVTVTKSDLVALGYGPSRSTDVIRLAKAVMVNKGFEYYRARKLGRVPASAVEEILGIPISELIVPTSGISTVKEELS
jgi:hypothetical protein|uniref:DUF3173 domain-containing protein n=1 Tax=Pediococcus parvulus TaxID=54062 RepID=UPI003F54BFFD